MQNLMKLIDEFTLEDQHYFLIENIIEPEKKMEVFWRKELKKNRWVIRPFQVPNEEIQGDAEFVLNHLQKNQFNLFEFEDHLKQCLITQAIYCKWFLESIETELGRTLLVQAEEHFGKFLQDLKGLIKKPTGLKLVR